MFLRMFLLGADTMTQPDFVVSDRVLNKSSSNGLNISRLICSGDLEVKTIAICGTKRQLSNFQAITIVTITNRHKPSFAIIKHP